MDWELTRAALIMGYCIFIGACVFKIGVTRFEEILFTPLALATGWIVGMAFGIFPKSDTLFRIWVYGMPILTAIFFISATIHVWQARAKLFPFLVRNNKTETSHEKKAE